MLINPLQVLVDHRHLLRAKSHSTSRARHARYRMAALTAHLHRAIRQSTVSHGIPVETALQIFLPLMNMQKHSFNAEDKRCQISQDKLYQVRATVTQIVTGRKNSSWLKRASL